MPFHRHKSAAFTLMELVVVITIIILLIAILIPSISAARRYAQNAATTAHLQSLSSAIDNYFQTFSNYPGPLPAIPAISGTTSSTTTAAAGKKISGTQNLLLGITYPVYVLPFYDASVKPPTPKTNIEPNGLVPPTPATYSANWVNIDGDPNASNGAPYKGAPAVVNPMDMTGPIDTGTNPLANYTPFYKPSGKELSGPDPTTPAAWFSGGVSKIVGTANTFKFPTILDRYPEAMPILYYRRTNGHDGTAVTNANTPPAFTSNTIAKAGAAAAGNLGSFYYDDNKEYTDTSATGLSSSMGSTYVQGNFSADLLAAYNIKGQAALLSALTPSTNYTVRGGYMLISAGYDHIYGEGWSSPGVKNGKTDDIILIGGQR